MGFRSRFLAAFIVAGLPGRIRVLPGGSVLRCRWKTLGDDRRLKGPRPAGGKLARVPEARNRPAQGLPIDDDGTDFCGTRDSIFISRTPRRDCGTSYHPKFKAIDPNAKAAAKPIAFITRNSRLEWASIGSMP